MNRIVAFLLILFSVLFSGSLAATSAPKKTLLVVGDSISAAYGLKAEQGWVALLQKELPAVKVVNASVSGDTTANGRARLAGLLKTHQPSTVVIALGGNDGLRGAPVASMKQNLEAMIDASKSAKARVVLIGVQMPPNYGVTYAQQFEAAYVDVAKAKSVPLVPSIVSPLGTSLEYFQADRIHPTAIAQPLILKHLLPTLSKAL